MKEFKERYVNPFTDYGFKRLFGQEPNKDLLLDFLNELLSVEGEKITELRYLKNEITPAKELDRRAVFDLYCTNERGEKFIVEIQKTKHKFFKDRVLYYSTFPIQEQAIKDSSWSYELKKVYTIAILDFVFDEDKDNPKKMRYNIKMKDDETNKVFHDKLMFVYLEMPKFNKKIEELETRFDKWLYVLKNLNKLEEVPKKLREKVFLKLFKTAEISKFTRSEYEEYLDTLKYYRDAQSTLFSTKEDGRAKGIIEGKAKGIIIGEKTGRAKGIIEGKAKGVIEGKAKGIIEGKAKGIIEGKAKGVIEVAIKALKSGYSPEDISRLTGLSEEEIDALRKE